MAEPVKAWQCIGCGRLDGPAPCVGICQDRPVELVPAARHEQALAEAARLAARVAALEASLRRIVATRPKPGGWEHSYGAMKAQAARALAGE
jgi:hypothetical protein